jgi:thiol:disulfide interchange protein DsbD
VNTSSQPSAALGDLWSPVIKELSSYGEQNETSNKSLWAIFGLGFLGGLIALFTPCVWPIIPMTVSFFLKRSKNDKKKGIRDAITYGISIVIIYVSLGLIITLIFGASALNSLSTNAIFNIFFFLMLVVFGASFLGGFEITLPSTWSNAVDNKASSSAGFLSIFLMAFTLSLVSFSCTGPIIGFLLVEMATANIIGPTVGMLGFAIALALPFTFFALFPTLLKSVPKSGNWMNVIKVTLGFIELAFALKFFSVADLAYGWHLMDREVFLCLWIVLFALLGAYLIGWIRFPHDEDVYDEEGNVVVNPRTSIPRFFMALISFSFALYMVPGLWGAPCKAVSAFAPPMNTQDFNLAKSDAVEAQFKDYEAGMQYAAAQGKPVLIDFTGFGCVNCRQMEAAVWTDETVKDLIENKYVLISLYVDDKTPLPEIVEVKENGRTRKLRTIGDKWSYFQRTKFGSQTQPFYVLLNNEGKPLNKSYSHDESISNYIEFLNTGLKNYKK